MSAEAAVASLVAVLFLLISLVLVASSLKRRGEAVLRLSTRSWFKIAMGVSAILMMWLIRGSGGNFVLFAFPLSWVVMTYGIDVLIERRGFYFASKFVPWSEVNDIRNTRTSLVIVGRNTARTKGFLKALWRIDDGDAERTLGVFRAAKNDA